VAADRDEHISRFNIRVNDAGRMGGIEWIGDLNSK